jgi:transcriptional regulator with XRE-family HTH domain
MATTRGERLRTARKRHFKSARAAAKALGVPPATYGAHERAESRGGRDFGLDEANLYAAAFKVPPLWLFANEEPEHLAATSSQQDHLPELLDRLEKLVERLERVTAIRHDSHFLAVDTASRIWSAIDQDNEPLGLVESLRTVAESDSLRQLCKHGIEMSGAQGFVDTYLSFSHRDVSAPVRRKFTEALNLIVKGKPTGSILNELRRLLAGADSAQRARSRRAVS